MTFEESMKRLDEIVSKMEKEELSLEETIKLYEEASGLSDKCRKDLEEAKLKITTLSSGEILND